MFADKLAADFPISIYICFVPTKNAVTFHSLLCCVLDALCEYFDVGSTEVIYPLFVPCGLRVHMVIIGIKVYLLLV